MSSMTWRGVHAAAALLVVTTSASADLIVLSATRSVSTGYSYLGEGDFFTTDIVESDLMASMGLANMGVALNEPGVFDGFASQTTSITSESFMGSFTGAFDAQDGISDLGSSNGAHADAQLVVFFTLTETTTFSLSMSSDVTGTTTAPGFQGLSVGGHFFPLGGGDVTEILTLDSGGYIFQVNIEHETVGLGSGAFTDVFSFNVIPGPGPLAALGFGLFVTPRRRRRVAN